MAQLEIGFIGCENADMILYIARLYAATGKTVAIIDYTEKTTLLHMVTLPEALSDCTGYYKEILMINGAHAQKEDTKDKDVLLLNFGYNLGLKRLQLCQNVVYVTDMTIYKSQLLKDVILSENVSTYLVIRNYVSLKYDEKYLAKIIGRDFSQEKILLIPYDETDYKASCYLSVDKKHKMSNISGAMRHSVLKLFYQTSEATYGRKEQAALLKRA